MTNNIDDKLEDDLLNLLNEIHKFIVDKISRFTKDLGYGPQQTFSLCVSFYCNMIANFVLNSYESKDFHDDFKTVIESIEEHVLDIRNKMVLQNLDEDKMNAQ